VTAARLIRLASLLSVSVRYFFDGIRSNTHPEANSSDVLYILLLTDHPVVEHAAYRCCGVDSEKYALLILHHLSDAIAFLRSNPLGLDFPVPDLVLMDLGMSERTAEQNIAMAMRDKSITSIPIVGFGDAKKSKEIQEIYRKPIAGFFETSLDTKEFEAKLKSVIDYWRDIAMLPALRMVRHHSFH
jgi:DNA-binding NarL/FixJ family response regulator